MTGFWTSAGGAMVGGLLSIAATCVLHHLQQKVKEAEKKENIKAALEAIYTEIATLWKMCELSVGMYLQELGNDKPFNMHYEITQDYFTLYNQNASVIASLPDQEIQKKIIQAYVYARRLIDVLRVNNYALVRHEDIVFKNKSLWELLAVENGKEKEELYSEAIRSTHASLVQVAIDIRSMYQQVAVAVQELLPLLRKKIESLQ